MLACRFLITLAAAVFVITGSAFAIFWAKGYRPDLKNGKMKATGLLNANSFPTGAQVFIDGKLTTATNNTINLSPGEYQIKIAKDGYLPWEKTLKMEKELVTQTNAFLFPVAPDLKALTYINAINPLPSPDGQKIAFSVASPSAQSKQGLYILGLSTRPLSFKAQTQQIITASSFDLDKAGLLWSPDGSQILAFKKNQKETITSSILLDTNKLNETPLVDQTARLSLVLNDWEEQIKIKTEEREKKLPLKLKEILDQKTANIYWSPDEEKILYTATASASIPENLIPPLPASNTQPQKRNLEPGEIYVYDTKEGKNFLVGSEKPVPEVVGKEESEEKNPISHPSQEADSHLSIISYLQNQYTPLFTQKIQWFPNSQHLIIAEEDKIVIEEYDGSNKVTVYSGPLKNYPPERSFVYPWPDGSQLVILTTLNKNLPSNLYAINLK